MSSPKIRPLRKLSFRLTLLYAGVCSLSLVAVLLVAYLSLATRLSMELDEHLFNEIEEYGGLLREQNLDVLRDVLQQEASSEGADSIFFRVLSRDGAVVLETNMSAWADAPVHKPSIITALDGQRTLHTLAGPQRDFPARIAYGRFTSDLVLQVGESTAENERMLAWFRSVFLAASALFVCFSVALGSWLAGRATLGVQIVTRAMHRITDGEWSSRVPTSRRGDEIDELALAFNSLIDRIQVLMKELREVSDNIAHDLRTPLTRIRSTAEQLAVSSKMNEAGRDELGGIVEECDHLLTIINMMLEISQTEAGAGVLRPAQLDLCALVEDVVELFRPAAEDRGIAYAFHADAPVQVKADAAKIQQIIAQLLDNAIKYTGANGAIRITCTAAGMRAEVSVEDTGAGIAPENHERIFLRFFRADESRTNAGNGLGLSLARALARAQEGDIQVRSEAGKGSTFTLWLPMVTP